MNLKIIENDITEALDEIKDNSIDLIFIDPPYNLGKNYSNNIKDSWDCEDEYISWLYSWLDKAILKLKKNGSLYYELRSKHALYRYLFKKKNACFI